VTTLSNLIKILAAVVNWLLSPEMRQQRKDEKAKERHDEIRKEVYGGDADALTARIDRLLTKSSNRIERGENDED
jgi:DNA-binding FadR family transcriptional regulator